jgi:uncharacterized protein YprB with RNaseH-like and TPR domain
LSLKERLERLVAATQERSRSRSRSRSQVHDREGADAPSRLVSSYEIPEAIPLESAVEGEEVKSDLGPYFQSVRAYPLDHVHGRIRLGRLIDVPNEAFSLLSRGDDSTQIALDKALFIDTETTGLAGGSGTCAFLIGIAGVEGDSFVVRQLFMREYREEAAILGALAERLRSAEAIVSYNGKSYDVPLLESRYILSRQRVSFENFLHFDLLHPARNLWKARFESCRLMELERSLLGLEREGDIPGAFIPDTYFRYLRLADASRLRYVFEHNRNDLLSLAALTVVAAEMLDEDASFDDPIDDFSLGRVFERASHLERSMLHYRRALDTGLRGPARRRTLAALATQLKRMGETDEARATWEELASESGTEAIQAQHELAMLEEHHDKCYQSALERCEAALDAIGRSYDWPMRARERWREAFLHRRDRLLRRLGHKRPVTSELEF